MNELDKGIGKMARATKTIRHRIEYRDKISGYFDTTKQLFNSVAAFYYGVLEAHPQLIQEHNHLVIRKLEQLTNATKMHPNPPIPLSDVVPDVASRFRRAAIMAAIGTFRSFSTNLAKWHAKKAEFEARLAQRKNTGKKANNLKFKERPPVPPRKWNKSPVFYADGTYKDYSNQSIMLKLWTGKEWVWCRFKLSGREIPLGYETGSPQVIKKGIKDYRLHVPVEKEFITNGKVEKQVKTANNGENPDFRILAVDLNLDDNIAVATVMNSEGTPLVTRFFRGGNEQNGFRKRMLGWIATNRSKTKAMAKDEQDNKRLWDKIHHRDDNMAHKVSRGLVNFALSHSATVIVFEHLTKLRPEKGRYSKRGNTKRAYWLKGKIFNYTKYKAWIDGGIITSRINPRNTSRDCASCSATPVIRYRHVEGKIPTSYTPGAPLIICPSCGRKDNADRNASVNIGKRLLARYAS